MITKMIQTLRLDGTVKPLNVSIHIRGVGCDPHTVDSKILIREMPELSGIIMDNMDFPVLKSQAKRESQWVCRNCFQEPEGTRSPFFQPVLMIRLTESLDTVKFKALHSPDIRE